MAQVNAIVAISIAAKALPDQAEDDTLTPQQQRNIAQERRELTAEMHAIDEEAWKQWRQAMVRQQDTVSTVFARRSITRLLQVMDALRQ